MDLVQTTIDFPSRKTRSQIKKTLLKSDHNDENTSKIKASPVKSIVKTKIGFKKTKSKAKINYKDSENITPSPERKNCNETPVKFNQFNNSPRSPLTPKRINCNPIGKLIKFK